MNSPKETVRERLDCHPATLFQRIPFLGRDGTRKFLSLGRKHLPNLSHTLVSEDARVGPWVVALSLALCRPVGHSPPYGTPQPRVHVSHVSLSHTRTSCRSNS